MDEQLMIDEKNLVIMKLLHYFITEKNYNPIILQGVENEIWLENLTEEYKVIRIVSNYIHNNEQFNVDSYKTERILKKIKLKTFSLKMNILNIFINIGDNVNFEEKTKSSKYIYVKVNDEEELLKDKFLKETYPDMLSKIIFKETGVKLFSKLSNDINKHHLKDATKMDELFKKKFPLFTYIIIGIIIICYFIPLLTGYFNDFIMMFAINGDLIRKGEVYRLFTGMFLHANLLHLFTNCYSLYILGSQIENYLGKFKFIIIYLISGVIGSLFSIIFNTNISVGASGAIFGLLGALLYFGYYYRVFIGQVVKTQIIPLIVINLGIGFLVEGIDNAAHIGGLLGGIITTVALGIESKTSKFEKINGLIVLVLFILFTLFMSFVYAK